MIMRADFVFVLLLFPKLFCFSLGLWFLSTAGALCFRNKLEPPEIGANWMQRFDRFLKLFDMVFAIK